MANPPHILAFPFPIPGHMNPLMYLCRRLALSCGFTITYACNHDNYKLMVKTRDLMAGSDKLDIRVVGLPDGVDSNSTQKPHPSENLEKPAKAAVGMRLPLEELLHKFQDEGNPVVCILTDTFNGWIQDVANKFGIPKAAFWTSNAINDILHLSLPRLIQEGFVPVSERRTEEPITFLPGIPPIPATDLPLSFYYAHPIVDSITDGARRFPEAEFGLCNSFEELEPHAISVIRKEIKANYFPVGPCLSPAFFDRDSLKISNKVLSEEDIKCLSWLDTQANASVIYVSFGSVATMSVKQFQDLAVGLEKSNHPFLLVLRKTLVNDPSVHEFFELFEERNRDRGLVISWAPQMHVLLHPAVGGFLTHCGWNSTVEGICAGVPMLAWPCMAEQNVNCRELVGRWKIALEVKENAPGSESENHISDTTVAKLVNQLMGAEQGKEFRKRAGELRDAARAALSDGGSSDRNMKAFAEAIRDRIHAKSVA